MKFPYEKKTWIFRIGTTTESPEIYFFLVIGDRSRPEGVSRVGFFSVSNRRDVKRDLKCSDEAESELRKLLVPHSQNVNYFLQLISVIGILIGDFRVFL